MRVGAALYLTGAKPRSEPEATLESFPNSSALSARSNTATPPIHPVKPTLRLP